MSTKRNNFCQSREGWISKRNGEPEQKTCAPSVFIKLCIRPRNGRLFNRYRARSREKVPTPCSFLLESKLATFLNSTQLADLEVLGKRKYFKQGQTIIAPPTHQDANATPSSDNNGTRCLYVILQGEVCCCFVVGSNHHHVRMTVCVGIVVRVHEMWCKRISEGVCT